ncbi:iron export ABC transporter permease subunit FetB [Petroclostridium sp. X23]|uniref:ABC transporter permease n=1 Tax=Petroclostridium sp. X23 TaxID=3045146 RepID=UPI0024AD396C|nr:iron export ABC transporter permease subunit FetB [Petroclostridium sp. X23]WHH58397.1 iron export ABC transporter permease subunit FetB [Petroclostridium sp. X23]
MDKIINLQVWQMAAAYIFILLLLLIVRLRGIPREKEILLSTFRMTLQLVLTGYILVYLFDHPYPLYTIMVIAAMEVFAIYNIIKRIKIKLSNKMKRIIAVSMVTGTLSSLVFFVLVVMSVSPWYDPRYFIPIAGMLIGNSMTGISLGVTRLTDGMSMQKNLVETALMLGATPKAASRQIVNNAFDSAILPTINSMVGMGIVFLPGMMTGQILSGTSPVTAIEYQIAIMLGILGSVALTVILFVQLGYKTFFNKEDQLIFDEQ